MPSMSSGAPKPTSRAGTSSRTHSPTLGSALIGRRAVRQGVVHPDNFRRRLAFALPRRARAAEELHAGLFLLRRRGTAQRRPVELLDGGGNVLLLQELPKNGAVVNPVVELLAVEQF